MKLPDVNVLLHAVDTTNKNHAVAKKWLEAALSEDEGIGLVWLVLVGFVRIATRKGILTHQLPADEALNVIQEWLDHPRARVIAPGERHADIFARLLLTVGSAGNLTNDAHLAAIAIENNAEVGTFDHDFKRFSGLKLQLLS